MAGTRPILWPALACCIWLIATPAPAAAPNIVMIIADDQGWGDYSFMGHPHVRTPHIDKLAKESLTFRRGSRRTWPSWPWRSIASAGWSKRR